MPMDAIRYLDSLLPLAACANPAALACALNALADLVLFHRRALYAKRFSGRAISARGAGQ